MKDAELVRLAAGSDSHYPAENQEAVRLYLTGNGPFPTGTDPVVLTRLHRRLVTRRAERRLSARTRRLLGQLHLRSTNAARDEDLERLDAEAESHLSPHSRAALRLWRQGKGSFPAETDPVLLARWDARLAEARARRTSRRVAARSRQLAGLLVGR
jgi:hypothetical protein